MFQWDKPANKVLDATSARLAVGEVKAEAKVPSGATSVKFKLTLPKGPAKLQTWLREANGTERGAFFVYAYRP
jgi:hypothetical protein